MYYDFIITMQSPVPSNQLLKQNTSPVPHFGIVTTHDQIEGVMPPIEEKNVLKSTSNPALTGITNASSFINELQSENKFTNNSNSDLTSSPHLIETEGQTSDESKNVSK